MKLKDKPFALIGVNVNDFESKNLKERMTQEKMNWRSFAFQEATVATWNPSTPSYYVLDSRGVIRHKWVGPPGEKAIDTALEKLINETVAAQERMLFDFTAASAARDWAPHRLAAVDSVSPAPEVALAPEGKELQITFRGGDWPVVGTTRIPVEGNWKSYQTLRAELTIDRPGVAYFGISQGKVSEGPASPAWERTMMLQAGRNDVTLLIRRGIGRTVLDPARGDVTQFIIGMFRPEMGQVLRVANVRLSPDWPPPQVLGWYSPYNHDGYSTAVARDFQRTGTIPRFQVLGTDLQVAALPELAKRVRERWTMPEPKTIDQVEAEFRTELERLKTSHPRALLTVLRDGEKSFDPARPDAVYSGWQFVYLNCHGPDGPNRGREQTPPPGETVEAFMRHRSVLLRADLSSIPRGAAILAARLVVTRALAKDLKPPQKPNLWVAEPCNRAWDPATAHCYRYAEGRPWNAVSGLYYGLDPDFWPVFLAHGPAGGGDVSVWDFTEALKFWRDGAHPNHGFFLHGDASDYMRMYTPRAREIKQRPAVLVIYDPRP